MKRILFIVITTLLTFLGYEDCKAQYDTLKFGDFGVSSITPVGSDAVEGSVWVEVENPLVGFTVSNVEGKLYKNGVALIEGKADDYYVPSGTSKLVLTGKASICPGISVFEVLGLVLFQAEQYSVDIKAVVTDDGAAPVVMEAKNVPFLTLLKKDEQENNNKDESQDCK